MEKLINCKVCNTEMASSAKQCPKCGAKNKKPIYTKWWFWVMILVIIIIIAVNSGENGTSSSNGDSTKTEQISDTGKEWVEVIKFSGKGDKKSEIFTYRGGKARLRYDFKEGQYGGMFAAYVVKEGDDVMREGGVPEVMLFEGESGESNLSHLRKGNYYLNITSANGQWTVIVEELK